MCSVEYEWDDSLPEDQRIHVLRRVHRRGAEHVSLMDASLYSALLDENRRKNNALAIVVAENTSFDALVQWSFTPGRVLQISFTANVPGVTKSRIQAACDLAFGPGKVEII